MRKYFENPDLEIQKLIIEDVITTSPGTGNGGNATDDDQL